MTNKILVLNSGSSSVKYRLFEVDTLAVAQSGMVDRIGESGDHAASHREAFQRVVTQLRMAGGASFSSDLVAVGHRIVHGGETFAAAVLVDDRVIERIRELSDLAPLHNPAGLLGIELCQEFWPSLSQVAVFDTAFHQTMPAAAYRYALPEFCYRDFAIRRYGFHGTSVSYVSKQAAIFLGRPVSELNLIVLHLGNGDSATAICGGQSVDTSMGMTPLSGLVMGTRSGDIDPAISLFLMRQSGYSVEQLEELLNEKSGLKGVAGSNDMREILDAGQSGDARALLALDIYVHRIRHYIGGYCALLGRVDALVFTGGVGEHAVLVRAMVCSGLDHLGFTLDIVRNESRLDGARAIHAESSRDSRILVIPTDEELEIARQTKDCLQIPVQGSNTSLPLR